MIHWLFGDYFGDYYWDEEYCEVFYETVGGKIYFVGIAYNRGQAYDMADDDWYAYNCW